MSRNPRPDAVDRGQVLYLVAGSGLLFTVPVLEVAGQNLRFLLWGDFWITLAVVAGIPGLVVLALALLMPRRLYVAATLVLTCWLLAGYYEIADGLQSLGVVNPRGAAMLGILLLIPVGLVGLSLLPLRLLSSVVGTAGCAIFAVSAGQFALALEHDDIFGYEIDPLAQLNRSPLPPPGPVGQRLPDIIYIVPDRYANARVLGDAFGHDNGGFLGALRQRGFAVADRARANYLKTRYSLASSMNMQYIEELQAALAGNTRRAEPLYPLVEHNLVVERLTRLGYRYVHVGSWWKPTRKNVRAEKSVKFGPPYFWGTFGNAVADTLFPLQLILDQVAPLGWCAALKRQLAFLETAGGDERPTFVFAHVTAPHQPVLVDAAGDCITPVAYPDPNRDLTWSEFTSAYSGYVTYLNRRFLEIFDRQRAANPNPLMFVLQADEGPFPEAYRLLSDPRVKGELWRNATDSELATKFGIMNALYLGTPAEMAGLPEIPDSLSPVNNWRIIFSHLEGRTYPLLPNRHFIFPSGSEPYHSIEITGRLSNIRRQGIWGR